MNSQPVIWNWDKKEFQKKDLVRKNKVQYKKKLRANSGLLYQPALGITKQKKSLKMTKLKGK
jgi:hypothetical protein